MSASYIYSFQYEVMMNVTHSESYSIFISDLNFIDIRTSLNDAVERSSMADFLQRSWPDTEQDGVHGQQGQALQIE